MPDLDNKTMNQRVRLNIRVSRNSLAFAVSDPTAVNQVVYEPYIVKSGISLAANLREAFKECDLLNRGYQRAQVLIDSPVLLIPIQEFDETVKEQLYHHSITGMEGCVVLHSVLPDLNAVAVFSINKDLKMVIDDHFADVRFIHMVQPVWSLLHQRSHTGVHKKLYAYYHDKRLEVFSFDKNRFRFCNSFDAAHSRDAVYFVLYAWKQMGMDVQNDELYVTGSIPDREWSIEALRTYCRKAYVINPVAEFNRAPVTQIKGMPFDLQTLFVKGGG